MRGVGISIFWVGILLTTLFSCGRPSDKSAIHQQDSDLAQHYYPGAITLEYSSLEHLREQLGCQTYQDFTTNVANPDNNLLIFQLASSEKNNAVMSGHAIAKFVEENKLPVDVRFFSILSQIGKLKHGVFVGHYVYQEFKYSCPLEAQTLEEKNFWSQNAKNIINGDHISAPIGDKSYASSCATGGDLKLIGSSTLADIVPKALRVTYGKRKSFKWCLQKIADNIGLTKFDIPQDAPESAKNSVYEAATSWFESALRYEKMAPRPKDSQERANHPI